MSIQLCVDTKEINLGSSITRVPLLGNYTVLSTHALPPKNINDIKDSYQNRWDDINYYMGGGGSVNGGTYTGNEINGGEA